VPFDTPEFSRMYKGETNIFVLGYILFVSMLLVRYRDGAGNNSVFSLIHLC